jgi:hypothetical protein
VALKFAHHEVGVVLVGTFGFQFPHPSFDTGTYVPEIGGHMMWACVKYGHNLVPHRLCLFHVVWNIRPCPFDKVVVNRILGVVYGVDVCPGGNSLECLYYIRDV